MLPSRLFLIDDHPIVLDGVRTLLEVYGLTVAGVGRHADDAMPLLAGGQLDLVIMDVVSPSTGGVDAARALLNGFPALRLVAYAPAAAQALLPHIRQAGVAGLVFKEDDPVELVTAIEIVRRGGLAYGRNSPQLLAPGAVTDCATAVPLSSTTAPGPLKVLTPRERDIFWLLVRGASVKSAAQALCISSKTVETHKYNIFSKLSIDSTVGLVKLAVRHGLPLDE